MSSNSEQMEPKSRKGKAHNDPIGHFINMVVCEYSRLNTQSDTPRWTQMQEMVSTLKAIQDVKIPKHQQTNFIEYLLQYMEMALSFISNESEYRRQRQLSNALLLFIPHFFMKSDIKNVFVTEATVKTFDLFIYGEFTMLAKKALLRIYNDILRETEKSVRTELTKSIHYYMYSLIDCLPTHGDFVLQTDILETIFRIFGRHIRSNMEESQLLPGREELARSLRNEISSENFDVDVRRWLNKFNTDSKNLFTIACKAVFFGNVACPKPDDGCNCVWVDFDLKDATIGFFVQDMYTDESDVRWNRMVILVKDVKKVEVNRQQKFLENATSISIHLSKPCISDYQEYQKYYNSLDKHCQLIISHDEKENINKLITQVLPPLFGNVFSHTSARVSDKIKKVYKPLAIKVSRKKSSSCMSTASRSNKSELDPTEPCQHRLSAITTSPSVSRHSKTDDSSIFEMKQSRFRCVQDDISVAVTDFTRLSESRSELPSRPVSAASNNSETFDCRSFTPSLEEADEEKLQDNIVTSSHENGLASLASPIEILSGQCSGSRPTPIHGLDTDFRPSEVLSSSPVKKSVFVGDETEPESALFENFDALINPIVKVSALSQSQEIFETAREDFEEEANDTDEDEPCGKFSVHTVKNIEPAESEQKLTPTVFQIPTQPTENAIIRQQEEPVVELDSQDIFSVPTQENKQGSSQERNFTQVSLTVNVGILESQLNSQIVACTQDNIVATLPAERPMNTQDLINVLASSQSTGQSLEDATANLESRNVKETRSQFECSPVENAVNLTATADISSQNEKNQMEIPLTDGNTPIEQAIHEKTIVGTENRIVDVDNDIEVVEESNKGTVLSQENIPVTAKENDGGSSVVGETSDSPVVTQENVVVRDIGNYGGPAALEKPNEEIPVVTKKNVVAKKPNGTSIDIQTVEKSVAVKQPKKQRLVKVGKKQFHLDDSQVAQTNITPLTAESQKTQPTNESLHVKADIVLGDRLNAADVVHFEDIPQATQPDTVEQPKQVRVSTVKRKSKKTASAAKNAENSVKQPFKSAIDQISVVSEEKAIEVCPPVEEVAVEQIASPEFDIVLEPSGEKLKVENKTEPVDEIAIQEANQRSPDLFDVLYKEWKDDLGLEKKTEVVASTIADIEENEATAGIAEKKKDEHAETSNEKVVQKPQVDTTLNNTTLDKRSKKLFTVGSFSYLDQLAVAEQETPVESHETSDSVLKKTGTSKGKRQLKKTTKKDKLQQVPKIPEQEFPVEPTKTSDSVLKKADTSKGKRQLKKTIKIDDIQQPPKKRIRPFNFTTTNFKTLDELFDISCQGIDKSTCRSRLEQPIHRQPVTIGVRKFIDSSESSPDQVDAEKLSEKVLSSKLPKEIASMDSSASGDHWADFALEPAKPLSKPSPRVKILQNLVIQPKRRSADAVDGDENRKSKRGKLETVIGNVPLAQLPDEECNEENEPPLLLGNDLMSEYIKFNKFGIALVEGNKQEALHQLKQINALIGETFRL